VLFACAQVVVDSGGGRDDASRRAHLDKLWRMGMEVSRNDIDRALLASGLTRADMDGLDRDIYESIKVCWMCAVRCALCPVPCSLCLPPVSCVSLAFVFAHLLRSPLVWFVHLVAKHVFLCRMHHTDAWSRGRW
jgi:hypothetical protein